MDNISKLLGEDYIQKFRVFHPVTLFEPNWEALQQDRCPLCSCKLVESRSRPIWYCKSTRHKNRFFIHKERLAQIKKLD